MKQFITPLYLLVLINLIGFSVITWNLIEYISPADRSNHVEIYDVQIREFDEDPYLNFKLKNTANYPLDCIDVQVSIFDTNDVHLLTKKEGYFSTFYPEDEYHLSVRLSYSSVENIEEYRFETKAISASRARVR